MSNIKLKEIQEKLNEKLKPSGWANKLNTFILSDDFYKILEYLYDQSVKGNNFTPVLKQLFRAFEECPYDQLKVVIVGQDPYPTVGVADGIAFSCSNTQKVQPSLQYIFKELERTVYPNGYTWDPDLKRWSNQGVLLINTALTTLIKKIGEHVALWKPFMIFLFDVLRHNNTGLVYVFMGRVAKEWAKSVSQNNYKFFTTHPASAGYNGSEWDSNDVFNSVNKILKQNQNTQIQW